MMRKYYCPESCLRHAADIYSVRSSCIRISLELQCAKNVVFVESVTVCNDVIYVAVAGQADNDVQLSRDHPG